MNLKQKRASSLSSGNDTARIFIILSASNVTCTIGFFHYSSTCDPITIFAIGFHYHKTKEIRILSSKYVNKDF